MYTNQMTAQHTKIGFECAAAIPCVLEKYTQYMEKYAQYMEKHAQYMEKYAQYVHLEAICAPNTTCFCGYAGCTYFVSYVYEEQKV